MSDRPQPEGAVTGTTRRCSPGLVGAQKALAWTCPLRGVGKHPLTRCTSRTHGLASRRLRQRSIFLSQPSHPSPDGHRFFSSWACSWSWEPPCAGRRGPACGLATPRCPVTAALSGPDGVGTASGWGLPACTGWSAAAAVAPGDGAWCSPRAGPYSQRALPLPFPARTAGLLGAGTPSRKGHRGGWQQRASLAGGGAHGGPVGVPGDPQDSGPWATWEGRRLCHTSARRGGRCVCEAELCPEPPAEWICGDR